MKAYYLSKHLMCEHYQDNFPVGLRVVKEKKGAVRYTAPSHTAILFLLEGTLRVGSKRFPNFIVHGSQVFPMPADVDNSTRFMEGSLVLVLYFIDSKFKFCHGIITDEMIRNAPKHADWLLALDTIKPMAMLTWQTADYVTDGLFCYDIQPDKQREFTAVMQACCSKDDLAPFLAPFYEVDLSFQDAIIVMSHIYPSTDEMVEKVRMSRPTFIRHFKQYLGETPKAWVSKMKSEVLFKTLLNTSNTLEQTANQLKLSLVQRLSTLCKETFGGIPSEIRNDVVKSEQAL